ncbi:MAG: AAA family ATPase [Chloroflexi bacterium]|nr:AAA family ATPase [Chloroflexota bacterium]
MPQEVPVESLRKLCDPQTLGFRTSADISPAEGIIGQARALRSLQFGLGIKEQGFNIFAAGPAGTGKTTAVKGFLEQLAKGREVPPDWCYVNNFRDPYRPKAISLPPGRGKHLQEDMRRLVESNKREIPKALESEQYAAKREETLESFNKQRDNLIKQLGQRAQEEGFLLQATPAGILVVPIIEDKPLNDQEFMSLSQEQKEAILQKREALEAEMKGSMRQLRNWERNVNDELQKLERETVRFAEEPLINELLEKYNDLPEVVTYLRDVQNDILDNISQFRPEEEGHRHAQTAPPSPWPRDATLRKYEVNVVVDNSELRGSPVITEFNPTYNNLFGRIEKEAQFGAFMTDFTLIRAGALHRANGGYLVTNAEELLRNLFSWDGIKRAIRNKEIVIEEAGERLGFMVTKSLLPDPIPLNTKIVIIGNPYTYHLLYSLDEEFKELFKVKADFDSRMDRTAENIRAYASSICTVCCKENLIPLTAAGVAKIVEHGSRIAEDQEKISTRFAEIADIMREANFWATQEKAEEVGASHVQRAIEERVYRSNLIQERIEEMISNGTIVIDTAQEAVGQVNGLSVISLGDFAFGRPSRITASVGVGREGITDIEREVKLAGRIYSKGVMIIGGYLTERYAQDKPLSLSSRLVFEQSYEEIEGDSASSTELYAILSRLSSLPIKQGIAVTGSVNQRGEVQAIGGVNEKIEGFFGVCKAKGLTGDQGVIIPASNVRNLMLKEEVVEAVREGKFHIYPVKTIDEGMEILTGAKAGVKREDGTFEEDTVNYRVDKRLRELAKGLRDFLKEEREEGKKKEEE